MPFIHCNCSQFLHCLKRISLNRNCSELCLSIHVYVMRNTTAFHIFKIISVIYIFPPVSSENLKMVQTGTQKQVAMNTEIQSIWNIRVF